MYAAETYSGAILEVLVHLNLGHMTKHQMAVEITIPNHLKMENTEGNGPARLRC